MRFQLFLIMKVLMLRYFNYRKIDFKFVKESIINLFERAHKSAQKCIKMRNKAFHLEESPLRSKLYCTSKKLPFLFRTSFYDTRILHMERPFFNNPETLFLKIN